VRESDRCRFILVSAA